MPVKCFSVRQNRPNKEAWERRTTATSLEIDLRDTFLSYIIKLKYFNNRLQNKNKTGRLKNVEWEETHGYQWTSSISIKSLLGETWIAVTSAKEIKDCMRTRSKTTKSIRERETRNYSSRRDVAAEWNRRPDCRRLFPSPPHDRKVYSERLGMGWPHTGRAPPLNFTPLPMVAKRIVWHWQ